MLWEKYFTLAILVYLNMLTYEGDSISNWPDIFLTDRHSQDFHSVFGHHI